MWCIFCLILKLLGFFVEFCGIISQKPWWPRWFTVLFFFFGGGGVVGKHLKGWTCWKSPSPSDDPSHLYGGFLKWWYPQIIHINRVFHYKPSILGYHHFGKHRYVVMSFCWPGGMIKSFIGLESGSGFCDSPDGNEYFGYFLTEFRDTKTQITSNQVTECPWDECKHIVTSLFIFLSFGDEGSYHADLLIRLGYI